MIIRLPNLASMGSLADLADTTTQVGAFPVADAKAVVDHVGELGARSTLTRTLCAAKVAALADALRGIPHDLAPCRRACLMALREQVYFGWELPLARARGAQLVFGKYEADGWWSEAAAALVSSGAAMRGTRQLERDHVEPVSQIVVALLEVPRSAAETAALLEERLVTCTVLAEEHRRLGGTAGVGWARYDAAQVRYRLGLARAFHRRAA